VARMATKLQLVARGCNAGLCSEPSRCAAPKDQLHRLLGTRARKLAVAPRARTQTRASALKSACCTERAVVTSGVSASLAQLHRRRPHQRLQSSQSASTRQAGPTAIPTAGRRAPIQHCAQREDGRARHTLQKDGVVTTDVLDQTRLAASGPAVRTSTIRSTTAVRVAVEKEANRPYQLRSL